MKSVRLVKANEIIKNDTKAYINNHWVVARPLGFSSISHRFKLAFLVFIGKYDAFKWTESQ